MPFKVRTFWDRDACPAHGWIDHDETDSIRVVVERIDAAHKDSAGDGQPACRVAVRDLHVHAGIMARRKRRAK